MQPDLCQVISSSGLWGDRALQSAPESWLLPLPRAILCQATGRTRCPSLTPVLSLTLTSTQHSLGLPLAHHVEGGWPKGSLLWVLH